MMPESASTGPQQQQQQQQGSAMCWPCACCCTRACSESGHRSSGAAGMHRSATGASRTLRAYFALIAVVLAFSWRLPPAAAAGESAQIPQRMVPRIAIVSEKAFHLEVLAGFISILHTDFGKQLVVYMHPMNFEGRDLDFGFAEFLQGEFDSNRIRPLPWLGIPTFDAVIFLSPEYRIDYIREFLRRSKAKLAIMMVHNGDAKDVPLLLPSHPNAHLMTLSPHVQHFVSKRLNITLDWMLPLKALTPKVDCPPTNLSKCLSGFAIQGAMDSRRRNYTSIFEQLDYLINSSAVHRADARLKINVVGSGKPSKLGVPPHLEGRIQPHTNLRFQDFYELIHQNLALLPALASDAYFDRKFSSTLITSLVTGTPVVVDRRFLKSYTFLTDMDVVRQWNKDSLLDALRRMLSNSDAELHAVRQSLGRLRERLSQEALAKVKALLDPIMPQIQAEWEQNPW